MQRIITLILLLITLNVGTIFGQSLNLGKSVILWGRNPGAIQTGMQYGDLMGTAIIMPSPMLDGKGDITYSFFVGLFYAPKLENKIIDITPMVGIFNKPYPSINGERINFGIELSKKILPSMSLYYRHTSNGYFGEINPGIDVVGLKVNLSKKERD